jgi:hypothetical protein
MKNHMKDLKGDPKSDAPLARNLIKPHYSGLPLDPVRL